jgi:cobalt-zinc-cadmium efflux system protein
MIVEVIGGLLFNSLALVSDAAHMLMDSLALGIAIFAGVLARRGRDRKRTYGYRRMEVLGGLVNGILLLVVIVFIVMESMERFRELPEVQGAGMSVLAVVGLAVNMVVLSILHPVRNVGINLRGAFLHVLGDLLGSVATLAAGVAIWAFGWRYMDPLASLVVAALVLMGCIRLLKASLHILMEGTPRGVDTEQLQANLATVHGVEEVHDVHVWTIGGEFDILTAHVVVPRMEGWMRIRHEIEDLVRERFGIRHVTIQAEEPMGRDSCRLRPHGEHDVS